jgi:integrase/recombinase XerD
MNAEFKAFLSYVASERGLSANTLLAYEQDLIQFFEFCSRKSIDPLNVSLRNLRDFLASLRKQGLASRSLARKLSAVKQFYKFCVRENRIESDPSELLSVTIKASRLPKHLTVDEMFAFIAGAKGENENEIRDRSLLEMWYATGSRVSEMAGLQIQDIDWKDNVIKIRGKGGRERLVPISRTAVEWGVKYRDVRHQWLRKHRLKETEIFYLTRTGKGFTRQGIWKIVKKYAKKAGLGRNVWPHMIRHSFATHVLEGGADLRAVQELLGHRSISTTEVYTHLDIENLKVMQLKYHPRG